MRLYDLLLHLALPFVVLRLYWRSLRAPAYRRRMAERFGLFRKRPAPGGVWIHAVSVGEVQAVEPLVRHLRERHPGLPVVLTTSTPTGSERVRNLFGDELFHVYFPYDLRECVGAFLDRVAPRLLVMVETEIWPNLLLACERRGIPALLANGRLSARSARGYARLGRLARETFARIDQVAAQSPADAQRFIELGVPAERVEVTGSIKFDQRLPASVQEQAQVVRRLWGSDRPVWVAASTHEGEEEPVLKAHAAILKRHPRALLVLVPRHPERFDRVAALVRRKGFELVRRSAGGPCETETQVFLGDTMGELPLFLGAADVAFIGGSLVERGGHNMLEASAQGVPVVFGPHLFNFSAIAALLLERGAAQRVENAAELAAVVGRWLGDASERSRIGESGRKVAEENRGALERLIRLVEERLTACGL